jgi:hypothetical protein
MAGKTSYEETCMIRMTFAVAVLSAGFWLAPIGGQLAEAKVNIDINIGPGGPKPLSCSQGRKVVERDGFKDVRARNCRGEVLVYTGRRSGKNYWIELLRRNGRILDVVRR